MEEKETISFRIESSKKDSLDAIAESLDRDRSFVINEAIAHYVELHEWQVAHIKSGLEQAERGEFSTEEEVQAVLKKYLLA